MSDLNDPRVFFAAERTLLAWSRTSITVAWALCLSWGLLLAPWFGRMLVGIKAGVTF